jgi:hypothetical protein
MYRSILSNDYKYELYLVFGNEDIYPNFMPEKLISSSIDDLISFLSILMSKTYNCITERILLRDEDNYIGMLETEKDNYFRICKSRSIYSQLRENI